MVRHVRLAPIDPTAMPADRRVDLRAIESMLQKRVNRRDLGAALQRLALYSTPEEHAKAWDALYEKVGTNQIHSQGYRNMIEVFLRTSEEKRLTHMQQRVGGACGKAELADMLRVLHVMARKTLKPEHLTRARTLEAHLKDRLVEDSLMEILGFEPNSRLFKTAYKTKHYVNLAGKPGQTLLREIQARSPGAPRYTYGETFARGSFGGVRAVMDEQGKLWAMKVTPIDPPDDELESVTAVEAYSENEVLVRVGSLIKPIAVFVVDEKVYSIAPLMGGDLEDLQALLKNDAVYPALVRQIFANVAADLQRSHAAGVLHRDLKPANILHHPVLGAVLADYGCHYDGLACEAGDDMGTTGYQAPEVLLGDETQTYGPKVDVFSLALTLLFMHAPQGVPLPFGDAHGIEGMQQAASELNVWRAARCHPGDPGGPIDWSRVARHNEPLDLFAKAVHTADPQLCEYIFEHMLQVNPERRHDSAQLVEHATMLFSQCGDVATQLTGALTRAAETHHKRDASIHALRHQFARRAQTRSI